MDMGVINVEIRMYQLPFSFIYCPVFVNYKVNGMRIVFTVMRLFRFLFYILSCFRKL